MTVVAVLACTVITGPPAEAGPSPTPAVLAEGMTLVAGTGAPGPVKEGVRATEATLNAPQGIAVGPDGTLYICDTGNHVVRAIGPDGVIRTIAGTGQDGLKDPPLPGKAKATEVALAYPSQVAVGPDGTLYFADLGTVRVYALASDGTMSLYVDSRNQNGLSAPMQELHGLAVAADGTLYLADRLNLRVIAVAPDRRLRIVAGVGHFAAQPGGQPKELMVGPVTSLAVDSRGDLWMRSATGLRRLSGTTLAEITASGEDTWAPYDPATKDDDHSGTIGDTAAVSTGRDGVYTIDTEQVIRRLTPDGTLQVVAKPDARGPVHWAAAAATPDGPVYVVDIVAHSVYAVSVPPAGPSKSAPAPARSWTWLYLAGALTLALAVLLAVGWARRRR